MMITAFLLFAIATCIGMVSAALGIGGGSLMVPFLVFLVGLDVKHAIAVSLFSVVSTSLSATIVYSRRELVNFKYGSLLEIFSVVGAIVGSNIAIMVDERLLKIAFSMILAYSAYRLLRKNKNKTLLKNSVKRSLTLSSLGAFAAGSLSGMLGIGGGVLKVPIMVLLLGLPIKVAIATSEFMISLTASTAALTYYVRGYVNPYFAVAAIFGSFIGASVGSTVAVKTKPKILRIMLSALLIIFSTTMILSCLGVEIWS